MKRLSWLSVLVAVLSGCIPNASVQNNAANVALRSGDPQAAIALYRAALIADPHQAPIYFNLAQAYEAQGDWARALAAYEQAILRGQPRERAAAYYNVGNLHLRHQQLILAVEAYQQALRADPTLEEARYNLELALALIGQPTPTPIEMQTNPDATNVDPSSPPTSIPGSGLPPTPSPTPEVPSQGTPELEGVSPDRVSDRRVTPNPLLPNELDAEAAKRFITDVQFQQENIGLPHPVAPVVTPGSVRDW